MESAALCSLLEPHFYDTGCIFSCNTICSVIYKNFIKSVMNENNREVLPYCPWYKTNSICSLIRTWKKLEFHLVLWASSDHIFLAQGHFLLDLVNDFIKLGFHMITAITEKIVSAIVAVDGFHIMVAMWSLRKYWGDLGWTTSFAPFFKFNTGTASLPEPDGTDFFKNLP